MFDKNSETPETADKLWEIAKDIPFLDDWKQRAVDFRLNKNAMWLAAVYELVIMYKQKAGVDREILSGRVLAGSDVRNFVSVSKQVDALLKRIADIERRSQIMQQNCPMSMDGTDVLENKEEAGGLKL